MTFAYVIDNKCLFECEAESIVEADSKFKMAFGKDPKHLSKVGCATYNLSYYDQKLSIEEAAEYLK